MVSVFVKLLAAISLFVVCAGHSALNRSHVQDKGHMMEHMRDILDMDSLSDEELMFFYFKVHDIEGNGKLDGCELVQALLHFHSEESTAHGRESNVLTDAELSMLIDPVLETDDKNSDGFIDYSEFVSGEISKEL